MKQRTEKQHYIPNKSYLDYFTDKSLKPPMLWVYFNKKEVFEDATVAKFQTITPANLCKESYLYETPRLPVNTIEKTLASIENNYKHVLDNKVIPKKMLTQRDKLSIAYFLSTLEVRTPLNKKHEEDFLNELREKVEHLEEIYTKGEKSQTHKELDEAEKQNLMFTQTLAVAMEMNRFQFSDMLFLTPQFQDDKMFFITSDFPVTTTDFTLMNSFYPPTPMTPTVEVLIPLTPSIALFVNNIGLNGYKEIDHNFVFEVNNRVLQRSNNFIISSKKLDKDFTRLNVKRHPQSFLLWSLADKLIEKRGKKIDKMPMKTIRNLIKRLVNSAISINSKIINDDKLTIQYLELFGRDQQLFKWLNENLIKMSTNVGEVSGGITYKLKRTIKTKIGILSMIKLTNPDVQYQQIGSIVLKIDNISGLKKKLSDNPKFSVIQKDDIEMIELKSEKHNAILYLVSLASLNT